MPLTFFYILYTFTTRIFFYPKIEPQQMKISDRCREFFRSRSDQLFFHERQLASIRFVSRRSLAFVYVVANTRKHKIPPRVFPNAFGIFRPVFEFCRRLFSFEFQLPTSVKKKITFDSERFFAHQP